MKTRLLIIVGLITVVGILQIPESFSEELSVTHTMGQIKWFEQNLHSKIPVYNIQVTDQDMDKNSDDVDKFNIHVWSDSDPVGIIIAVYETEKNSGIFDSLVYFSEDSSIGQRLHVYDGNIVTATYADHTLPLPYTFTDTLEISDTLTIYYPLTNENQNHFIRINDDSFTRQSLKTGETISASSTFTSLIMGSLGPTLIVLFIVIYAVKKRMVKKSIKERNEN